ncbi:MAG: SgcJ/EcaC family oxidoreductase [Micromonosporaceae bacterium]
MSANQAAAQKVPQQIMAAWADHNADAFADVFTEDATLILPGNLFLKSREEIRSHMKSAFAGPYKGTRVFGEPVNVRAISNDVTVLTTQGGVLAPGETEVAPERAIWATWVVVATEAGPRLASYQNTPKI